MLSCNGKYKEEIPFLVVLCLETITAVILSPSGAITENKWWVWISNHMATARLPLWTRPRRNIQISVRIQLIMPILTQFRQINITYIKDDSFFSLELFTDAKNDNLELWKKITSFHRLSHILILRNLHKTKALVFLSHENFMDYSLWSSPIRNNERYRQHKPKYITWLKIYALAFEPSLSHVQWTGL